MERDGCIGLKGEEGGRGVFDITGSFIMLHYCPKRQNIFYGSEMEGISRSAGLQLRKVLVPPPRPPQTSCSPLVRCH